MEKTGRFKIWITTGNILMLIVKVAITGAAIWLMVAALLSIIYIHKIHREIS
jgi:hypothetical protein